MCKINPRVDFAFKKLFGSEENKDLLISLINSVVSESDQVKEVELKNPYNFANYTDDKSSILDIKAKNINNGTWFDIEMQIAEDAHYDKRSLFYWSQMLDEQLSGGDLYKNLTKTICINILDFKIPEYRKNDEDYHSVYKILNTKTLKTDKLHDIFEIHYIELEKFKKDYPNLKTSLDRWLSFLNTAHEIDKNKIPEEFEEDEAVIKAIDEVDRMFNEEEREKYKQHLKYKVIRESQLDTAIEKGLKKGLEKGLKKGREEGREEGLKKGREDGIKAEKLKTAEKLLIAKLDIEFISNATGLTEKEILKIKDCK